MFRTSIPAFSEGSGRENYKSFKLSVKWGRKALSTGYLVFPTPSSTPLRLFISDFSEGFICTIIVVLNKLFL